MLKLPDDEDSRYFMRALQHTPTGKRYYRAVLLVNLASREMRLIRHLVRLKKLSPAKANRLIEGWRRGYIEYSNQASAALDELAMTYDWPPGSAANRAYVWQPAPAPRNVSPTHAPAPKPDDTPRFFLMPKEDSLEYRLKPLFEQGYRFLSIELPPKTSPDD